MANESDYIPEGTGPDGTVQEGDDLKESSKDTLASYLSNLTTNPQTQNSYPIQDIDRIETSLNEGGLPAEFQTGGEDGNTGFTRSFLEDAPSSDAAVGYFETLSNSGKIENLSSFLNKNSQSDGHHLLTDIISSREPGEPGVGDPTGASSAPLPTGARPVQQRISSMLRNGNRFDPTPGSSPYIEDGSFTEPGMPIEQGLFGVYDDEAVRTSLDDLNKIARSMMVRATGHRLDEDADPDGGSVTGASNAQQGIVTINSEKTRALNAFSAPTRASLQDAELRYDDITGDPLTPRRTHGNLSSYRETFEEGRLANYNVLVDALGDYLLSAAVFTAIITLVETLEAGTTHTPGAPQTLKKGEWHKEPTVLRIMRQLGIPNLNRPTWLCAIYGFAAWLKIPPAALPDPGGSGVPTPPPPIPSPGVWGAIVAWFSGVAAAGDDVLFNILYSSGYYANTMRVARRDLERLLTDVEWPDGGETSGPDFARSIFELMIKLQTYASWNFFVAILRMGDAWLSSYQKRVEYTALKSTGQTRQTHSRTPGGSSKLAWRHRSAPALLLLNKKYVNAATVYGYDQGQLQRLHNALGDGDANSADTPYHDNLRYGGKNRGLLDNAPSMYNRIPKGLVELAENELDAEYCPFYFHDLRTNELISFHAFLTDIKDTYAVSYAETGGYGRIDKVKIYQDTTRSINISWTLVATSPKDFDSMWYSVNKLISMLYPQFSMGKPVTAGNKKFIQPFSQIPTASPVIRLRVGDVIRSNYSRFNLARIFGLSEVQPAQPASAGGSAASEINKAPFDVTAGPAIGSATAAAAETDAENEAALEIEMVNRFESGEPATHSDLALGYLPGHPSWGVAILQPSSQGYTTYDTNIGVTVPPNVGAASLMGVKNNHTANPPADDATHVETTAFLTRPVVQGKVKVLERVVVGANVGDALNQTDDELKEIPHAEYYVQYEDRDNPADPYGPVSEKRHYHTYVVTSADLEPIPPGIATTVPDDPTVTLEQQITDVTDFFDADNNAIVRSFEAAGGRGLAGVITSFDMDWAEAQWDMSGIGRRAPTMLTISVAFSPIHDIIPGLDNNGMMRAMNYPVGNIAGPLGTDTRTDPGAVRPRVPPPGSTAFDDAANENYGGFTGSVEDDE